VGERITIQAPEQSYQGPSGIRRFESPKTKLLACSTISPVDQCATQILTMSLSLIMTAVATGHEEFASHRLAPPVRVHTFSSPLSVLMGSATLFGHEVPFSHHVLAKQRR
jgi:hypothetical protein